MKTARGFGGHQLWANGRDYRALGPPVPAGLAAQRIVISELSALPSADLSGLRTLVGASQR